jgi:hypothetical protein
MKLIHNTIRWFAAALAAFACCGAQALDLRPGGAFVQGGLGVHTHSVSAGAIWPWAWKHNGWGGEWSGQTEVFVSHWRADDFGGGHQGFTQIGVSPMLRLRFDQGRSAWFVEAGIGLTTLDKDYRTPHREFATRFNFIDSVAVGRNFGASGQHELSLRAVHVSNANIKRPNPGEDFLVLRYARRF